MPALSFPLDFPLTFGGGEDYHAAEEQALLGAIEATNALSVESDTELAAEIAADANAVACIWACNRRLENQINPLKMLEALPDWEDACGLRPAPTDTDVDRHNALAGKLLGQAGNALPDLDAVARQVLGQCFVSIVTTTTLTETTYWPGVNPGPPGKEWSSNRARIAIVARQNGVDDDTFGARVDSLKSQLRALDPCWQTFDVGTLGYVI